MTSMPKDMYWPETQAKSGPGVLIITAKNVEDIEFFYPYYRLIEEGYRVDVATPEGGPFAGKHGLELKSSKKLSEVSAEAYAMLYLPGGKAPIELMKNQEALTLTKAFADSGKPIAAICHGPQILAAAGVIKGETISAFPEVEKEVKQADAHYVSKECQSSGQFITARWPGDLPAHMKAVMKALKTASSGKTKIAA